MFSLRSYAHKVFHKTTLSFELKKFAINVTFFALIAELNHIISFTLNTTFCQINSSCQN